MLIVLVVLGYDGMRYLRNKVYGIVITSVLILTLYLSGCFRKNDLVPDTFSGSLPTQTLPSEYTP